MGDFFPPEAGSYALIGFLDEPVTIQVGSLGQQDFHPGWYAYLGSAFGLGGLRARIGRHLRTGGPQRWQIDYLKAHLRWAWVAVVVAERKECVWAQALQRLPESEIPVPGFGASDCHSGCQAHLIRIVNIGTAMETLIASSATIYSLKGDPSKHLSEEDRVLR